MHQSPEIPSASLAPDFEATRPRRHPAPVSPWKTLSGRGGLPVSLRMIFLQLKRISAGD